MSDLISVVSDTPAVPTNTTITSTSSVKSSKRFGRSPAQSIAPVSQSPTPSKSFPFSKASKNKQKTPTSSSAIASILSGMNAHPISQSPGEISPQDPGPSKTPFIYRKVARPSTATSAGSSGQSSSAADAIAILRARTLSENSVFPSIIERSLQATNGLHAEAPEQPTASTSSLEPEPIPSGRLVGRGGIGSRPRKAIATKNLVIPTLQSLDAVLTADSPHIALRPSGRGGLASRPKQLAPPPPPPKSPVPVAEQQGPLHLVSPTKSAPVFVRPGGRGGMGAHANANSPPLTLKDILSRKKPKFGKKSKARARNITTLQHPISSHLANEITNASTETLSTLHFAGESTSPPPSFFHEPQQSIESASADDISLTPPSSATASTFDGSLSLETEEDDLDINIYLEDAPPNLSPEDRQQRSINKLTRTFGDNPYDEASGALTHMGIPAHNESSPKVSLDGDPSPKKDRSTKKFRRASISVSSIFGRAARIRDSDDLDSQSTIDTISDDLHRLGLGDDDMSESWGEVDTRRMSICGAPESPIMFSLPSPLPQTEMKRKSTLSAVYSVDSDQETSVPSSTLSRSRSYTQPSRPQNTHISHNHSTSASLDEHAFSENGSVSPSVNWLFPPSDDGHDFKLLVTSNKHPEKPLAWTGEWNTDMQDVIRALRELR